MLNTMSDYEKKILSDDSFSYWLKNQMEETKMRDVLDALNDVEVLKSVLEHRLSETRKIAADILQSN